MLTQLSTHNLIPNSTKKATQQIISFEAIQNPFSKSKVAFRGSENKSVVWPKSDQLGQTNFSKTIQTHTNTEPEKDSIVTKVQTGKDQIKVFAKDKVLAQVKLASGVTPESVQVGFQDNKGGFALKLWDSTTKTAYVLFQNQNEPAQASIPGRFNASVSPSKPAGVSFLGTKTVDQKQKDLEETIKDAIVVGMFGGFGTRLMGVSYPNTKPTTKLGANSFEVNMLKTCANAGFRNFGASIYFGPDIVKNDIGSAQATGKLPEDMQIAYAQQDNNTGNLGTAGAVRHTIEHMLAGKVADQLKGKSPEAAEQTLKKELGESVGRLVWEKIEPDKGHYDAQLKQIVIDDPELREKIFDKKIDNIPFIAVVSGDHVTDIDMKSFAHTHLESEALFTLALREVEESEKYNDKKSPYGHASIDHEGKITAFNEKPYWYEKDVPEKEKGKAGVYSDDYKWLNTGVYMMSPKVIKMIPSEAQIKSYKASRGEGAKEEGSDFGKNIIPQLVALEPLQGHCVKQHWADVGNNIALQGEVKYIVNDINKNGGTSGLVPGQNFDCDANKAVSTSAEVKGVKVAGDNSTLFVSDNAKVGNIEVQDVVYVGPDAVVPDGKYRNVWADRLEQPLFAKGLDLTA